MIKLWHISHSRRILKKNDTTIDVKDIFDALSQINFPPQRRIELLLILNYVLREKYYPEDLCGLIDKQIELLRQLDEQAGVSLNSNLRLSRKKGFKVNFIRVINILFRLSFFTNKEGNNITKKEVFEAFGRAINQDLSSFQNHLSATKSAANSDMRNTLVIFEEMHAKQQEINHK